MSLGDVVDQLLNQYGLSDSGSSEESNLSSSSVGSEKIDDLDSGLENFGSGRLVDELGRVGVDGSHGDTDDRTSLIDGLSDNVHNSTEASGSDGNENGRSSVDDLLSSNETFRTCEREQFGVSGKLGKGGVKKIGRTIHGDGSDGVFSQVHRDLEHESVLESLDLEGVENRGEVLGIELNIDDGTNNGFDATDRSSDLGGVGSSW